MFATAPHLISYNADLDRLVIVLPREQQLRVARRLCEGPRLRRMRWQVLPDEDMFQSQPALHGTTVPGSDCNSGSRIAHQAART